MLDIEQLRAALDKSPMLKKFLAQGFWHAHYVDIVWRFNGEDIREQGDWLKDLFYLVRQKPTIEQLERALTRTDLKVEMLPDGSVIAVEKDRHTPSPSSKDERPLHERIQHVYTRNGRAVVCGIPDDSHNCDQMACSSVEHVLARVEHSVDEKPARDAMTDWRNGENMAVQNKRPSFEELVDVVTGKPIDPMKRTYGGVTQEQFDASKDESLRAALEKDAARYRWLRSEEVATEPHYYEFWKEFEAKLTREERLDRLIDQWRVRTIDAALAGNEGA